MSSDSGSVGAVIFDLDGVLTDTAELHYRSWQRVADEHGLPFERAAYEAMRGLSREDSLRRFLAGRGEHLSEAQRAAIIERKNVLFIAAADELSPADLLPGAAALLRELRRRGVPLAVASSSRNARRVIERLGIADLLDVIVDGNDTPRTKPEPDLFLLAAQRVGVRPEHCVVVEDASSGVQAAVRAGMRVAGLGPPERVAGAAVVRGTIAELSADLLLSLPVGR